MIKHALSFFLDFFSAPFSQWQNMLSSISQRTVKPLFNGCLPRVKQNQRQALKRKANRRARRLGHA